MAALPYHSVARSRRRFTGWQTAGLM